jgi:hypothetical protein
MQQNERSVAPTQTMTDEVVKQFCKLGEGFDELRSSVRCEVSLD